VDTALDSHFDHSTGRLLRFRDDVRLTRLVARLLPVDLVFVMVNTDRYGGSGTVLRRLYVHGRPLPAPTFASRAEGSFLLAVHELGHAMAGLGDEYADPAMVWRYPMPPPGADLRHPNLMLAPFLDRSSPEGLLRTAKWAPLLAWPGAEKHAWAHEGGYLRQSGVYRAWPRCRMRDTRDPFCPVCCFHMARAMAEAVGDTFVEPEYRRAFPLSLWDEG
jgi:hypothetical protein